VRGSSYFVIYGTALQFRYIGQGPPLEDLVDIYKYTGNNFEHDGRFVRYEYVYKDKKTGEEHIVFRQVPKGIAYTPRETWIRVPNKRKHVRFYVGHYDSEKYKEQMKKFKAGEIKSRPNGRRWCLLKRDTVVQQGEVIRRIHTFYARPDIGECHYDDVVYYDGRIICDN
jgi:hypothetical protein